jgi:hypothetical protein
MPSPNATYYPLIDPQGIGSINLGMCSRCGGRSYAILVMNLTMDNHNKRHKPLLRDPTSYQESPGLPLSLVRGGFCTCEGCGAPLTGRGYLTCRHWCSSGCLTCKHCYTSAGMSNTVFVRTMVPPSDGQAQRLPCKNRGGVHATSPTYQVKSESLSLRPTQH